MYRRLYHNGSTFKGLAAVVMLHKEVQKATEDKAVTTEDLNSTESTHSAKSRSTSSRPTSGSDDSDDTLKLSSKTSDISEDEESDVNSDSDSDSDNDSDMSELNEEEEKWLDSLIDAFEEEEQGASKAGEGEEETFSDTELNMGREYTVNDEKDEGGEKGLDDQKMKDEKKEKWKRFLRDAAIQLNSETLVDLKRILLVLKILSQIYQTEDMDRTEVGDLLASLEYADMILGTLRITLHISAEENKYATPTTLEAMNVLINFSDASQKFVQELADEGGIKFFTSILDSDKCYATMDEESRWKVKSNALYILYNMSRDVSLKPKFKKAKTAEVVLRHVKFEDKKKSPKKASGNGVKESDKESNRIDKIRGADCKDQSDDDNTKSQAELTAEDGEEEEKADVETKEKNVKKKTFEDDDELITAARLLLAYIADDNENSDSSINDTGTIKKIVQWLVYSLAFGLRVVGFSNWELTQGLAMLAGQEGNAKEIVENGALILLQNNLENKGPKEQAAAALCLWKLAFVDEVREQISKEQDLVQALKTLETSDDKEVKNNVQGALWEIEGREKREKAQKKIPNQTPGTGKGNHIFISYSSKEKDLVKKIHKSLVARTGRKVWVDWLDMKGSTVQAMAEAVEKSAVVLICMSKNYEESAFCRSEAEYTFEKRKVYIPLLMQQRYKPDGWLGLILGAKKFYDFSGKYPYEKKMQELLTALKEILASVSGNGQGAASSLPATTVEKPSHLILSKEDVQELLRSKGLTNIPQALQNVDGEILRLLKEMRDSDRQYFHKQIKQEYGMNLIDFCKFNAALDDLQ